jgi:hypothetical protein
MPPTPQSFRHTGLGNQKKPAGWESPPPLPSPGTPEFESWAAQPQRDTSGDNSRMVGHQEKPRNASAPDVNPHRISLDEHGDSVDADVAAMHAAHADIANDEQFAGHKPEPAKTKLGGGEIDPKGIAEFQANLIADRQKRGVPEQGDYAQKKSAWEAAGGSSGTGTAEEANAMLKEHRSRVAAKPAVKAPKASVKSPAATPEKEAPASGSPDKTAEKEAPGQPSSKPALSAAAVRGEMNRVEQLSAKTPSKTSANPAPVPEKPAAAAPGKLERVGGNFAPRSTPTSMSIPSNAAGTKFTVLKATSGQAEPSSPAPTPSPAPAKAPAENKTRFMPAPGKPAAPAPSVPVSPPLASARPEPPSTGAAPRTVHPAPTTARATPATPTIAASKSIGSGNKAAPVTPPAVPPTTSTAPSAPAATTPKSSPTAAARSSSKSTGGGNGWGEVHHHIHNYYGETHVGDQYVNHGGVQNIGGTLSIGQSGGSTGGGSGHGGSGNPRGGTSTPGRGRTSPSAPSYGKPTIGQAIIHTALNSTVNGKSVNDAVHATTGNHIEQRDTQGRRIGDPHSDTHKMRNVHRVEGHQGAASAYHEHEQLRSHRMLGQQFTP